MRRGGAKTEGSRIDQCRRKSEECGARERDRVAPREDRLASEDRDESKTERVPAVQIRPDQKKWRSGH